MGVLWLAKTRRGGETASSWVTCCAAMGGLRRWLHCSLSDWSVVSVLQRLCTTVLCALWPCGPAATACLGGPAHSHWATAVPASGMRHSPTQPRLPTSVLCRCVVMVGLPYPNPSDPELQERMHFADRAAAVAASAAAAGAGASAGARAAASRGPSAPPAAGAAAGSSGREYYKNLCMKAVNQVGNLNKGCATTQGRCTPKRTCYLANVAAAVGGSRRSCTTV